MFAIPASLKFKLISNYEGGVSGSCEIQLGVMNAFTKRFFKRIMFDSAYWYANAAIVLLAIEIFQCHYQ